jgi:hypothetical protein
LIGVLARDEACLSCFRTGPLSYEQGARKYSTVERVEIRNRTGEFSPKSGGESFERRDVTLGQRASATGSNGRIPQGIALVVG